MKKKSSDIENYITALEGLVSENSGKTEKTADGLMKLLIKALADEWLAAYQYWVCKNLSRGSGKLDVDPEFDQHYKEEMQHADDLMERIKQLGGRPIFNPNEWLSIGNPWTEVNTTVVKEQLAITIQAEKDAIAYYKQIVDYAKGFDEVTLKVIRNILEDEEEHRYDLEMILEQQ